MYRFSWLTKEKADLGKDQLFVEYNMMKLKKKIKSAQVEI